MNKLISSALVMGAGMAAFNYMQRNDMIDKRQLKRMRKKITKAIV